MYIDRHQRKVAIVGSALTALAFLLLAAQPQVASAATVLAVATPFGPGGITGLVGLAAVPGTLFYTTSLDTNIHFITDAGATGICATLPAGNNFVLNDEMYLAVSSGLGGFPAANTVVYVTQANHVYSFPATCGGGAATLFATIAAEADNPGIPFHAQHTGITFDTNGAFANTMITTYQDAKIYTINSGGVSTLLAALPIPQPTEGPSVTTSAFAFPSNLVVAQESQDAVYRIPPAGIVGGIPTAGAPVVLLKGYPQGIVEPESTHVVPATVCELGPVSHGAFFTTDWTNGQIYKFAVSDFSLLGGSVVVPFEDSSGNAADIGDITVIGLGGTILAPLTAVGNLIHEGSTFVPCVAPPPPVLGCPATKGFWHDFNKHKYPDAPFSIGGIIYYGLAGGPGGLYPHGMSIGGKVYSQVQLDALMPGSGGAGGNGFVITGSQLIAAILNLAAGAQDPGLTATITAVNNLLTADGRMVGTAPGVGTSVNASPANNNALKGYSGALDAYNSATGLNCSEASGLHLGS